MEISPSDEEINIWMDKALDTVDHFTSIPVNPQSSLGKNTIKAGNTKSIIKSAERKARAVPDHANAAPNATVEPATDRPYQTVQPVTKPKQPRKARALPCPSSAPPVPPRVSEPQEEPYEELGAPAQEDTPLLKQAVPQSPSSGKLKSSQLPPLDNSNDSSNPSLSDQNIFKRGISKSAGRNEQKITRHRREFNFVWSGSRPVLIEWCNPICTPITPNPRRQSCRCGRCPSVCKLCEGDYHNLARYGSEDESD
ncbi:V protein [Tuhoko virus 1]|uniref:V protein n=1 Tax=Tuhoko virus 1 TaxID=798072 RepID=D8WJ24_9MONO|nr:V protein [Tuhoko virus 1]ADI80711.1 V protein [Tuhoko virus 1]